jgi:hypothetical protein
VTEQHVWMASVSALPIFPKCCFQGRVAALLFDAFCSTDQDLVRLIAFLIIISIPVHFVLRKYMSQLHASSNVRW